VYASVLILILQQLAELNLVLAIFNMLPIPPLDGSKIFSAFLPPRHYFKFIEGNQISSIIFIIFILSNAADYVLFPALNFLYYRFYNFAYFIFGL
ncbi:MAG: site-2 protease family protein, partial [Clostridiales bacterium]|jgi:Zn-dependent protease|nr:site-2 protease family protein [Clostridiales bacterium]